MTLGILILFNWYAILHVNLVVENGETHTYQQKIEYKTFAILYSISPAVYNVSPRYLNYLKLNIDFFFCVFFSSLFFKL